MVVGRALHYVFKIGDRKLTAKFYKEILGMKVSEIFCFKNLNVKLLISCGL